MKGGDGRPKKLDFLYDDTPCSALLNGYVSSMKFMTFSNITGYSPDQLRELQEKLKDVQSEAIRNLEYESEIREVIGILSFSSFWISFSSYPQTAFTQ